MKKSIREEIDAQKKRGVLLILTGPTGAGKDTVYQELKKKHNPSLIRITTTTSRKLRTGESEGNPYHFISRAEFEDKIGKYEFFEWVEFRGELYGTQKQTLQNALESGNDVIWIMEAKGVKNIKEKAKSMTNRAVFIYLVAPDIHMLENRVHKDERFINTNRWNQALVEWEMEQYDDCDYLVINEDGKLEEAVAKVGSIIEAKRMEILQ